MIIYTSGGNTMSQNIYDNKIFFKGYKELRDRDDNYNELLEQPAMADLLPNLSDKIVLDLACGYGYNSLDFIKRNAKKVVGIDISQNMLNVAESKFAHKNIEYLCMDMTEISQLKQKVDFVYCSLAFHYVEDFKKLCKDIFALLNNDGQLLFSQEHPIITATVDGEGHFNKDESGNIVSYTFSNYNQGGIRKTHWFIDDVIKYHRPIGELITTLAKTGFIIEEVVEPLPKDWAIKKSQRLVREYIKPNFLIIKARK